MPSHKSCFSRLRKNKFLTFPPVLFFQTSANTPFCFNGSSLGVCPCLLFSCEVLPFYAEVASKNAPQTRHKQLVQHPVDTAQSGIFLLWNNPPNIFGSYSFCGHLLSYSADSQAITHLSMPGHLILLFQGLCFSVVCIEFPGTDFQTFLQFTKIILNSTSVFPSAYKISQPDVLLIFCNC